MRINRKVAKEILKIIPPKLLIEWLESGVSTNFCIWMLDRGYNINICTSFYKTHRMHNLIYLEAPLILTKKDIALGYYTNDTVINFRWLLEGLCMVEQVVKVIKEIKVKANYDWMEKYYYVELDKRVLG